jgi:hypothetical protein
MINAVISEIGRTIINDSISPVIAFLGMPTAKLIMAVQTLVAVITFIAFKPKLWDMP